ncbi:MAG: hypothetical protein ACYC3X_26265 [Pirellulaceae bacterium]
MNNFYENSAAEFETRIADLRPTDAYLAVREIAFYLAENGFVALPARFAIPAAPGGMGKRSVLLLKDLQQGYGLYGKGAFREAFEMAERVRRSAEVEGDVLSDIDALHLQGRIYLDTERYSEATTSFAEEMNRSQQLDLVGGFFRAVHEMSRVHSAQYDMLRAEFGFRFAWDYYTASMLVQGEAPSDAPGSNFQNSQAALRSLQALSETYTLMERGPREADVLIERLASPHFSNGDESAEAFLQARGLATLCIASIPAHRQLLIRMASRAMGLHGQFPKLSSFLLEEGEFIADLCGDVFPRAVRRVLTQCSGPRALAKNPFYKASTPVAVAEPDKSPFGTPETAAESASVLLQFLKDADHGGRYVYRGQTRYYPGPLLPSAFRPILTDNHGRTTKSAGDNLYDQFCLRKCGKRFYGEYNRCFQAYANPLSHLAKRGVSAEKTQAAALLYKRILDDPTISLAQEGESYIPWIDALRRVLSAQDFAIFTENQAEWMLRINNYHRRMFRMDRFVSLFGYTLGTTLAQQYGFSSEGLDATKNLDVAFFFATRDSADFATFVNKGVGVIYRIPFGPNDIAASPLDKYDYYTLPSIVDVKDVIYRFEFDGLQRSDARTCLDAYVGASLIDGFQDQDLLFLPEGFYETTRVAKQDAVIIFPDEIREDHLDREPGVGGIRFPRYRYIEDLAERDGVQKFYFKHSAVAQAGAAAITREKLWPRDDVLLEMVVRIILASYRARHKHAKRPDLIDVGYDNEAFAKEASDRYWKDRPVFFTEYEKIGASLGAITF